MALVDRIRSVAGFPRRAWDRRTSRWGDIVERVALAVAIVFIFIAFQAIQNSREETVRIACEQQNVNHDRTLVEINRASLSRVTGREIDPHTDPAIVDLDLKSALAALSPAKRLQVEQSLASTRLIIDRLAPKRDCAQRVAQLVTKQP